MLTNTVPKQVNVKSAKDNTTSQSLTSLKSNQTARLTKTASVQIKTCNQHLEKLFNHLRFTL